VKQRGWEVMADKKKIVVTGDLIWDYNLVKYPKTAIHHSIPTSDVLYAKPGGAWYLKEMIELSCPIDMIEFVCTDDPKPYNVSQNDEKDGQPSKDKRWLSNDKVGGDAYQIWSLHNKIENKKDSGLVWRIGHDYFLGCNHNKNVFGSCEQKERIETDILVLDDIGLSFRDSTDQLDRFCPDKIGSIILKTVAPLCKGSLWEKLIEKYADRLTIILPVCALRARGADISKALSWDRTIEEIVWEFDKGFSAQDLAKCRRAIVYFGTAGVASFSRIPLIKSECCQSLETKARLERFLYHPDKLEGSWESMHLGQTFGKSSILTSAMVRHELQPQTFPLYIALGRGLAAIRNNHELGAGPPENFNPNAAHEAIEKVFNPCNKEPASQYCTAFPHSLLDALSTVKQSQSQSQYQSNLMQDLTGNSFEYVSAKATEVVLYGVEKALRTVPNVKYGKYLTVDRQEIERINAIRNLIIAYQKNPKDQRPLSIAVFGTPGSGKSFAIKQLASELFGEKNLVFEFNLSQFRSDDELIMAFHQIRDASVQSQIPLVFWDEFDTKSLEWLKYFLCPMQDAKFYAGSNIHPFGKAVFVFAGGTCTTFGVFDRTNETGSKADEFRDKKGPDFVSRLRGFVNIKGPNPVLSQSCLEKMETQDMQSLSDDAIAQQDIAYLIRRAIMLRASLSKSAPHLIDSNGFASICAGVVRGFLRVKKFLHGARSLDAIVSMSSLSDVYQYGVSELPSPDLLNLHVTSDFMNHVREGELEVSVIEAVTEALAEACHEAWKKQKEEEGYTYGKVRDDINKKYPLMKPYAELDEKGKEGNRATARLTPAKLLGVGYRIQRITDTEQEKSEIINFADPCIVHRLRLIEHDIWLRSHLLDGYEWSATTDDALRLHKDVVLFKNVSPSEQELDVAITNSIPEALRKCGYTLVKIESDRQ